MPWGEPSSGVEQTAEKQRTVGATQQTSHEIVVVTLGFCLAGFSLSEGPLKQPIRGSLLSPLGVLKVTRGLKADVLH